LNKGAGYYTKTVNAFSACLLYQGALKCADQILACITQDSNPFFPKLLQAMSKQVQALTILSVLITLLCITQDSNPFLYMLQAMSKQVQALTKVVGKKEEQLQALRHHQTHMTTTIEQLQGEVKKNGAAAAADKAAKTYAADLQTKVCLCPSLCAFLSLLNSSH